MPVIHTAQIDWDDNGQPLSRQYDDMYFSPDNGLEESRYVFLQHNRIAQRLAALKAGEHLVIGETGFGTGLNFLSAWQAFSQHAGPDTQLHFISAERAPLAHADLTRALALWPELAPFSTELLGQYRAITPGFQRLVFAQGRVILTLMIGDATECFSALEAKVDAWFLDGFSPAKNPEMWTQELFEQLAKLSAPSASIATFTSAGFVRRGLNQAGFGMQRVKGFGQKHEMLAGNIQTPPAQRRAPWFDYPAKSAERHAIVVGAGLAGCASAASLAARGWQVTLLERHSQIAQEASGNPQGILYLKLSAHGTALTQLVLAGFGYTRRLLERLQDGRDWQSCGVLQLAFNSKEARRQEQLSAAFSSTLLQPVDQAQAQAIAGIGVPSGGLYFPEGGWVHPPALCAYLIDHPNIKLVTHSQALHLERHQQWHVLSDQQLLAQAPVVVLACAAQTPALVEQALLPLKQIGGQISALPATAKSRELRTVLCAEGYVAPPFGEIHTLGASFNFSRQDTQPSTEEHISNLALLEQISMDLSARLNCTTADPETMQGRAAFRCTTPDYLPMVGPVANAQVFAERYAVLGKDARQVPDKPCPWLPGLFINTAHGSRGLITTPLSAELLAAWINHEPLPVSQELAYACHPNRFILRKVIRNE